MKPIQILGYDGTVAYEVELTEGDDHKVYVVKARKAPGFGYAYAAGANTYRSTIKAGGAIWKKCVKEAKAKVAEIP